MSEDAPSRSVLLDLREERGTLREGHAFLEEKSLLLAGEIVRELGAYEALRAEAGRLAQDAADALGLALARHGLEELQLLPAPATPDVALSLARRQVVGVELLAARPEPLPSSPVPAGWSSPEARRAREAFARLVAAAAGAGASAGNLERLSAEYRRCSRRERALADVLMPEMDRRLAALETRLEDLEREDAIAMRPRTP